MTSTSASTSAELPGSGRATPQAVELRHLRYFVAVAEVGNFTQAAEQMFIAQPTLTEGGNPPGHGGAGRDRAATEQ
jgi:hypothetical protein